LRYITRMFAAFCRRCCLGLALALFAADVCAMFIVNQPWVVPASKGRSTEAYMDLTSSEGATVVAVKSDAARKVGIAAQSARRLEKLKLPPGAMVRLAPRRYRLVLDDLTRTIKRGERVKFALVIEAADGSRQEIPVDAEARFDSPLDAELRGHRH
jgi:copper(I)-binding protein